MIDIGDYIAYTLSTPETALDFIDGLRQAALSLAEMPERCALIRDDVLAGAGVRCMPYKNYYIFYQVLKATRRVTILRVGYNRKNWKETLRAGEG